MAEVKEEVKHISARDQNINNNDDNKYDSNIVHGPNDAVMKHDPNQRTIWYFTNHVLDDDCEYYLMMHNDSYISKKKYTFVTFAELTDPKCGIYYVSIPDPDTTWNQQLYLAIKMYQLKDNVSTEITHKFNVPVIGSKHFANKKYTKDGFLFPFKNHVNILDACTHTWFANAAKKMIGMTSTKDQYYRQIVS
eukprot:148273_1